MDKVSKIFGFVDNILILLAKILLAFMVVIVSINVFMRYALNTGIRWTEEISLVSVVWFTFIALAHGVKEKLHINMNLLPSHIAKKYDALLNKFTDIVILFVGYVMLYYGIKLVEVTSHSILPASNLPAAILYFPLIVSGILVILNCLLDILGLNKAEGGCN